jgi:hypothetical protein
MTGADLGHLETLEGAFETAGAQIADKAEVLRGKIDSAVDKFVDTLNSLARDAAQLSSGIDREVEGVSTQASGVQWTGTNRDAFNGDMSALVSAITTGTAALNSEIAEIKGQVEAKFTPVLTQFGTALTTSADDVNTTSKGMKAKVTTQRDNLDQAANVGWLSA